MTKAKAPEIDPVREGEWVICTNASGSRYGVIQSIDNDGTALLKTRDDRDEYIVVKAADCVVSESGHR